MVVDLRPFVRRQHGPDRLVDAAEALKIRIASLAIAPRRLVDHEKGTGRVPQRLHQAKLAVRVKVMDRQAAPRDVGVLRPPRDRLDEIAMVKGKLPPNTNGFRDPHISIPLVQLKP